MLSLSHIKTRGSRADRAAFPGRMLTCHSGNQIEKSETGGACSTYMGEERCIQGFGVGNRRESDHLEDPGVDERIILRWVFRKWDEGVDWIDLAQDRDRWRALANGGNEPSGSIKCGEFLG